MPCLEQPCVFKFYFPAVTDLSSILDRVIGIVGDGLSIGPDVRSFAAYFKTTDIHSARHFDNHNICAIVGCGNAASGSSEAYSDQEHEALEKKDKNCGVADFTLK